MSEKDSGRIVWIDQLRAVAFYFVILGHVQITLPIDGLTSGAKVLIYSFHMPLFFMLSGITFNRAKVLCKGGLKERIFGSYFKRLIIPYLWMNFILFPLWAVTFKLLSWKKISLVKVLVGIFAANPALRTMPSGALWFLVVLFFALCLYCVIVKLTKGRFLIMLPVMISLAIVGYCLRGKAMILHINVIPAATVFIWLGNIFMSAYKNGKLDKFMRLNVVNVLICIVLIGVWGTLCYLNGRVSMVANKYGGKSDNLFLFYLCAVLISLVLFYIVEKLPRIKPLTYIGQNTMLYIGIHTPIIRIFEIYFPTLMKNFWFLVPFSIALYFAMIPFSLLFNKAFPYICGLRYEETTLIKAGKPFMVFCALIVPVYIAVYHFVGTLSMFGYMSITVFTALMSVGLTFLLNRFLPIVFLKPYKREVNKVTDGVVD